jgi:hypothetical protein
MNKNSFYLMLLALLFFVSKSNAQESINSELPAIQTDRPDQTECPFLTPIGWFQLECGLQMEQMNPMKIKNNNLDYTIPTILTKYGINKYFELRLITENIMQNNVLNKYVNGITPLTIGFKAKLADEKGIIPQTSVICHLGINQLASKYYKTASYIPSYRFTMMHTISEKMNLSYNLGTEWNGNDAIATFIYTLTTGYSFSNKLGGYIEVFGFMKGIKDQDNRCDGGITYQFTENQQFDISAGLGLSTVSPAYYLSCGYSFRFKK